MSSKHKINLISQLFLEESKRMFFIKLKFFLPLKSSSISPKCLKFFPFGDEFSKIESTAFVVLRFNSEY